jgi:hypothetical protein
MEMNRQTLSQRISDTIRAKQQLVFFATALAVLDFAAPLLVIWLGHHRPLTGIIADGKTLFETLASPSVAAAGIVVAYLLLAAWLRSGYIRSIVGTLHLGPQNSLQFGSMLGLQVITYGYYWLTNAGLRAAGSSGLGLLVYLASLVVLFALLYADYAIVISWLDPLTAIRRSWVTGRQMLPVSVAVILGFTVVQLVLQWAIDPQLKGSFVDMLLLLAVRMLAFGAVAYLTDVILVVVYIDAIERGVVPPGGGRIAAGGTMDGMR